MALDKENKAFYSGMVVTVRVKQICLKIIHIQQDHVPKTNKKQKTQQKQNP